MTRRRPDDRGVAATLVAILLGTGVILGMAAISVDVGTLYAERRQLQNGADAAALAVGLSCVAPGSGCDTSTATGHPAKDMANGNARDGASQILQVCVATSAACPQSGSTLTQCPTTTSLPYVQVRTGTLTSGGSTLMPPYFAKALAGNGAYAGSQVIACSQAGFGAAGGTEATLPFIISECEWVLDTSTGASLAPPPPYASYPTSYEKVINFHTTSPTNSCTAGNGVSYNLPGGFGWLTTNASCQNTITVPGTATNDPGVSVSNQCKTAVAAALGKVVFLPVFTTDAGSGAGGTYQIQQAPVAFYLTGWNIPGMSPKSQKSIATNTAYCNGNNFCLYGWFTTGVIPSDQGGGGPNSQGAYVVKLVG